MIITFRAIIGDFFWLLYISDFHWLICNICTHICFRGGFGEGVLEWVLSAYKSNLSRFSGLWHTTRCSQNVIFKDKIYYKNIMKALDNFNIFTQITFIWTFKVISDANLRIDHLFYKIMHDFYNWASFCRRKCKCYDHIQKNFADDFLGSL